MQTLTKVLLLGFFAAIGACLAISVALHTESDSDSQGRWLLSMSGPPAGDGNSRAEVSDDSAAAGESATSGEGARESAGELAATRVGESSAVGSASRHADSSSSSSSSAAPPVVHVAPPLPQLNGPRDPVGQSSLPNPVAVATLGEPAGRSVDREIAERAAAVTQQVDMMRAVMQLIREETERRPSNTADVPASPPAAEAVREPAGNQPAAVGPDGAELSGPTTRAPEPLPAPQARIQEEGDGQLVINIQNADIRDVLEMFSEQGSLNILPSPGVEGLVSASLRGVDLMTGLEAVVRMAGFQMREEGRFIYVGTSQDMQLMDRAEERIVTRVYRPNYVSAAELQTLITPLLTQGVGTANVAAGGAAGPAQVVTSSPPVRGIAANSDETGADDFAGSDVLMVRDFLSVLHEVDQIVFEVDQRPRQVVIEAMILSVRLDDSHQLGVNFELLRGRDNARLVSGNPLNDVASLDLTTGGLKFGFLDTNVGAFIDALETIGDTNVIASPRLMCLNKQRAEILIGSQLGYVSTTVTENAATQAVEFLEVGTQLRLRPYISDDGLIRMEVHPELSTGSVRIEGGFTLPDKEVTQVTTNVMCRNGCTIIIGGLIREDLGANASHIPLLGTLPGVGRVFQQKSETIDRREIVVLLTPRIVSDPDMAYEGSRTYHEFMTRQDVYADKMSPVGKRYYGKRFLRQARAAWNAGDASAALRYANLSVHYNPLDRAAVSLREEIVANSPYGDATIDRRLRDGLSPLGHPRHDYSRCAPWKEPLLPPLANLAAPPVPADGAGPVPLAGHEAAVGDGTLDADPAPVPVDLLQPDARTRVRELIPLESRKTP